MKRNHLAPVSTTHSVSVLLQKRRKGRLRERDLFVFYPLNSNPLPLHSPFSTPFPILDRVQVFFLFFFSLPSSSFDPFLLSLSVTVITVIMDHEEEEEWGEQKKVWIGGVKTGRRKKRKKEIFQVLLSCLFSFPQVKEKKNIW